MMCDLEDILLEETCLTAESCPVLAELWDNPYDAIYDELSEDGE